MTMKNTLIALGILAVIIAAFFSFNAYKSYRDLRENTLRVESEMRFKQLIKERVVLGKEKDSISSLIGQKQALIDFLENNPQVIIQNNDKIKMDINRLDAFNSIKLFADNVSKYDSLKNGRYNLHRFDK
jgi:hypothetical protein